MPYVVYVLYSKKDKKLYVGCTSDLKKRLAKHQCGEILATKYRLPLVCIHREVFVSKADAFNRERFFEKSLGCARKTADQEGFLETT